MHEVTATVTRQGQVTVPAEIRQLLGLNIPAKIVFVVTDEGEIRVRTPRYTDLDSLQGAAGKLARPLSWQEMRAIAYEDRFSGRPDDIDG